MFNQGFGDLFVIRVAGNIIAPSQIGSVEYAVTQFNTKLRVGASQLRHGSKILENAVLTEGVQIAGAEYCLETGLVDFFDVPKIFR